jgi:hypothetical protein
MVDKKSSASESSTSQSMLYIFFSLFIVCFVCCLYHLRQVKPYANHVLIIFPMWGELVLRTGFEPARIGSTYSLFPTYLFGASTIPPPEYIMCFVNTGVICNLFALCKSFKRAIFTDAIKPFICVFFAVRANKLFAIAT